MSRKLLRNCVLLDPEAAESLPGALLLADGHVEARLPAGEAGPEDAERVDLGGRLLAPGFVDLHHHGRLIFEQPEAAPAALAADAALLVRHGTTSFLPTTVARPADTLAREVEALAAALDGWSGPGARPFGIHLEGPWINAEAAGAQPPDGIRAPRRQEVDDLLGAAAGSVRMVTFAPELDGASQLLAMLTRRGVVAALGHSLADASRVDAAVGGGAAHVTHLFNAMGGLHQRRSGLAGAALADDRVTCDLICDGAHVHAEWVRVAARCKGAGLVLITDRIEPRVERNSVAEGFGAGALASDGVALRLPDGRLAGSCVTLDRAARNAVAMGAMTQIEAVAACSLRPARVLGLESQVGTLRPGARADLVVLSEEGGVLETWIAGQPVYRADA